MPTLPAKPPGVILLQLPISFRCHFAEVAAPTYDKNDFQLSRARLPKTPPEQPLNPRSILASQDRAAARRVALVGFGTVGRAVARILGERNPGDGLLRLTHICNRNIERKKQPWVAESWIPGDVVWTDDFQTVLNSEADIVVELIGGLHPAEDIVRGALTAGKSVVTANKQLIARHGPDLLQLASANGCQLEFGASVAGGVPVLPALRTGLSGDRLHGIAGILNGTCNYILSRIETDRIPFSEALEEAQARGYAEADASEDLDGGDARAKLSILALAGLHVRVSPGDIRARTIRPIDAVDFDYAAELGCTIRQISRSDLKDTTLFADVGPSLVPKSSPFGRVQKNLNLVLTSGEYGGDMAFLGAGAGGDPTAVAVVSDLMFVAETLAARDCSAGNHPAGSRPVAGRSVEPGANRPLQLASPKVSCDFETPWYLRFLVKDQPGIIAGLAAILSSHQLNIDAVLQNPGFDKNALPFVITLEPCHDAQLQPALHEMSALPFALRPCLCLPILR
jgi:homoserine dehydrogenase